jgi:3-oxoacyl-[acyl-carrier protein] reductase
MQAIREKTARRTRTIIMSCRAPSPTRRDPRPGGGARRAGEVISSGHSGPPRALALAGRVAIITGAARGIGCAIAIRFAREGCQLVLCDRDVAALHATAAAVLHGGGSVVAVGCDVCAEDAPDSLVASAMNRFGRLDVLVNNAGVVEMGYIQDVTAEDYDRVMDVDVHAVLRMTRAAVEPLRTSGRGRVINLGSIEGLRGSAPLPLYCAAKHAVVGLTRATALQLGRYGITVNAICPGPVETEMLKPALQHPESKRRLVRHIPAGRLGTPNDVAGVACFLAGDDAAYVNGHALVVDGGMSADAMGTEKLV